MTNRLRFYQALFAFSFLPHVNENPIWVSVVTSLFFFASVASGYLNRPIVSKHILRASALLAPIAIFFHFKTILGAEAASPLLCLLVGLKLNEMREERDEMVILILCILLAMNWLLFSQTLLTTLYMCIVLLFVGIGLMLIQSPKKTVRDLVSSSGKVLFRDVIIAVPVFLAFFFLFPRFSTPLGSLFGQQGEQTGFNDSLTPGTMANLIQSEEVAFRAIFEWPRPRQQLLYWQGKVLENTDGWQWSHPQDLSNLNQRFRFDRFRTRDVPTEQPFKYELVLEPRFNQTVFYLETPISYAIQDPRERNRIIERRSGLEAAAPLAYRLKISGVSEPFLKLNEPLKDADLSRNLQVPFRPSDRMKALVAQFKSAGPPEAISQAVLNYFADQNFVYTTSTPDIQSVEQFLFDQRAGFCEHYASSYAILMRMSGVPARVVVGFQGGEYNSFGDYLVVRDKNAHSWDEIYIEGKGWMRVDPTSVVSSGRINDGQYSQPFFGGLDRQRGLGVYLAQGMMFFESLNSRYILFLLDYDSDYQMDLFSFGGRLKLNPKLLFGAFAFVLLSFALFAYIWGRRRRVQRDLTSEAFAQLLNYFAKLGFEKRPTEGPLAFIERVQQTEPKIDLKSPTNLVFRYISIRYSADGHIDAPSFVKDCFRFLKGN